MLTVEREGDPRQMVPYEHRIFTRVPFVHAARWSNERGDAGSASVRDVSRSGVGLSLESYLRPGPAVCLTFDGIIHRGAPVQVMALCVWCRPDSTHPAAFVGGFTIVHGESDTLGAMSEVFYAALRKYAEAYC